MLTLAVAGHRRQLIAQIVKAELAVRAIEHVAGVGRLLFLKRHARQRRADGKTQQLVNRPHPFAVPPRQIRVDGRDMRSAARQSIQTRGKHRRDGLPPRIGRKPPFFHAFFLFKQLQNAPQAAHAHPRQNGRKRQGLYKRGCNQQQTANHRKHRPACLEKMIFRFHHNRMKQTDRQKRNHADQDAHKLHKIPLYRFFRLLKSIFRARG